MLLVEATLLSYVPNSPDEVAQNDLVEPRAEVTVEGAEPFPLTTVWVGSANKLLRTHRYKPAGVVPLMLYSGLMFSRLKSVKAGAYVEEYLGKLTEILLGPGVAA